MKLIKMQKDFEVQMFYFEGDVDSYISMKRSQKDLLF